MDAMFGGRFGKALQALLAQISLFLVREVFANKMKHAGVQPVCPSQIGLKAFMTSIKYESNGNLRRV